MRIAFFVWVVAGLLYEFVALARPFPGDTISEIIWATAEKYPILTLAFGLLMGHLFWQRH